MTNVRISLVAFICFGVVALANPAEKGDIGIGPTDAHTETSKLLAAIQSQQELIESLEREKTRALIELEKARSKQPQEPDSRGWEHPEKYRARQIRHQAAVQAAQDDVKRAQESVDTAERSVDQAQKNLAKMQSSQLPAARKSDEQQQREASERERQRLESKKP